MIFLGEISALTAAFLWSNSSIIFTSASLRIGAIQLNIDRLIFSSIFLIFTIFIFQIDYNINYYQLFFLSISGIIGLIIGDTAIFRAFSEIGPRYTMLFYSTNPIIAAFLSWFILDEKLNFYNILGILITIIGISIVAYDKKTITKQFKLNFIGIFYGFLSAIGQGIGLIFAKLSYSYGNLHSFTATFVRIFTSVLVLLIFSILLNRYKNPFQLYLNDRKSFKYVLIGSIIGPYLGISLSFIAIENTSVGIAATLMSTTPIMLIPLSKYFYKEQIHFISIIGTIIAVLGVSLLFIK